MSLLRADLQLSPNSAEYMLSESSETFHKNLSDNISNVMKLQLACLYSAIKQMKLAANSSRIVELLHLL